MADIGVFVERYTISRTEEMGAIMRLGYAAQRMGHRVDVLFRPDIYKIPQYDALYIRTQTDPLNATYVAARTAQMHGLRVIDDPDSIIICCDKIKMYRHLIKRKVPMPETRFLLDGELTPASAEELLDVLGSPVVLKAPDSSFSMYVEKAATPKEVLAVGKKFFRRADRIVAQRFVSSKFDWRVGVLGGEVLYVCQYLIPKNRWKVLTHTPDGHQIFARMQSFKIDKVSPKLLDTALKASASIGKGLYGVDIKQVGDDYVVIEVNDNPTIAAGDEDAEAPHMYDRLVSYLAGKWG
ncbi:MAG: RimK family alpha-L-glutamate ligase [SAR202 cluster bacterium]|nr:RimK family alpha-L-glutamate ligase [SAR202 cluster bacterium]